MRIAKDMKERKMKSWISQGNCLEKRAMMLQVLKIRYSKLI